MSILEALTLPTLAWLVKKTYDQRTRSEALAKVISLILDGDMDLARELYRIEISRSNE